MKGKCKNCEKEFNYYPSQKNGIWCSNRCQGDYKIKNKFTEGTTWTYKMRGYVLRQRGESCEECGITDWNDKPISFQIDHINGIRTDNRLDNLKVMCPNCHSQTDTFGQKNISEEGIKRRNAALMRAYEKHLKKK